MIAARRTQFEEFPRFMTGVKEVKQLDDTHMRWHAEIWGEDKEWDSEIVEQMPDQPKCTAASARARARLAGSARALA